MPAESQIVSSQLGSCLPFVPTAGRRCPIRLQILASQIWSRPIGSSPQGCSNKSASGDRQGYGNAGFFLLSERRPGAHGSYTARPAQMQRGIGHRERANSTSSRPRLDARYLAPRTAKRAGYSFRVSLSGGGWGSRFFHPPRGAIAFRGLPTLPPFRFPHQSSGSRGGGLGLWVILPVLFSGDPSPPPFRCFRGGRCWGLFWGRVRR